MTLMRYNTFNPWRDFDRLFGVPDEARTWKPAIDIAETDESYIPHGRPAGPFPEGHRGSRRGRHPDDPRGAQGRGQRRPAPLPPPRAASRQVPEDVPASERRERGQGRGELRARRPRGDPAEAGAGRDGPHHHDPLSRRTAGGAAPTSPLRPETLGAAKRRRHSKGRRIRMGESAALHACSADASAPSVKL